MKTLVVGGAGFIGSHLCEKLLQSGHSVVCVDDLSLGTEENIAHIKSDNSFHFYCCDAADEWEMMRVFKRECPEYVFHLAANSDIQKSSSDPLIEYKNTYTTTFCVLSCMRALGIKNIFFSSTSAVYGDKRDVSLDELTSGLEPISYYGAAKLGSEALLSAFAYMNDMNALVFRFPNVIGPRLTHGVIYDFIGKLKIDCNRLEILGDGKQSKPYIYVDDLIDAILYMFEKNRGYQIYNIGVEGDTSVKDIADIVCEEMGLQDVSYNFTGGEGGWKGDVPSFKYCLDKIHDAGWRARLTSDKAVRLAVKWNIS